MVSSALLVCQLFEITDNGMKVYYAEIESQPQSIFKKFLGQSPRPKLGRGTAPPQTLPLHAP